MLGKLFPHTLHFHVFRLDLTQGEGEAGLLAGGGEREYLVEVGEETLALFLILLSIPLFLCFPAHYSCPPSLPHLLLHFH